MSAIITDANLKDYLEITGSARDNKLTLLVAGVNAYVNNHTRRDWASSSRDDLYPGLGGDKIVLKHYPVASLTAVTEDTAVLDVSDDDVLILDAQNGFIIKPFGRWRTTRKRIYRVQYTGGPASIPGDLKLATLEMAAYVYHASGGRREVKADVLGHSLFDRAMIDLPLVKETLGLHTDYARTLIEVT